MRNGGYGYGGGGIGGGGGPDGGHFVMFAPGPWGGGPQPQPDRTPEMMVPPRVMKAMQFLAMLTQKTMKRPVASDLAIEIVDGQSLTDEEAAAQATACNMLNSYFAGKLKPDAWENLRYQTMQQRVAQGGKAGSILHCIACGPGRPNPSCQLCEGTGKVIVSPITEVAPQGMPEEDDGGPEDDE